jgi:GNAT superfamily N-acetyltransferase
MIRFLRVATPDDATWITACHAAHYTRNDGFDGSFRMLVADILADFFSDHDPLRERGWIAMAGDQPAGSIFCVAGPEGSAKLRLFLIEPEHRGTGLAQQMLDTCLGFAREAGYPRMQLWTHESHVAAGRLYARNCFQLMESHPVTAFGQRLVSQTWVRDL